MTAPDRDMRTRTYLMCPPENFAVESAINPWMDTTVPVDTELAIKQWTMLRDAVTDLGHTVHVLAPGADLPDMVFAANGAFSVDGVVYGARFRYPQRTAEAQDILGRPVISLHLVDPRFYHLDTALAALDDTNVIYYPAAFSPSSRAVLRQLFPDAVIATDTDALAFGLNLVSDGRNIVLNSECTALATRLSALGYHPILVDLAELKKGGGSVKCCMAELRD